MLCGNNTYMKKILIFQIVLLVITAFGVVTLFVLKPTMVPRVEIIPSGDSLAVPETFSKNTPSLVNPAVLTDMGKHYIINFKPLRDKLVSIQQKYKNTTYIYFLYLNNGVWVGLGEKESFTAASTLKVPLAMSLMKAISEKKLALSDRYDLERLNLDSNFGDLYKAGEGKELSVDDFLKIMLELSDNTAMNAIFEIFNRIGITDPLADVYSVLGWEFVQNVPEMGKPIDYSKINLKTLANMFLALYNAKYLNVPDSEKILHLLAQTPFDTKIVAGVPKDIIVSHKIGVAAPDSIFSDCGIVYVPNRHYLLCLGSSGADEKTAASFMAEVSKEVYQYVMQN